MMSKQCVSQKDGAGQVRRIVAAQFVTPGQLDSLQDNFMINVYQPILISSIASQIAQ